MTTKAEYQVLVDLYKAGKGYEANQEAQRLIRKDVAAEREILISKKISLDSGRRGIKAGVEKRERKPVDTARLLSDIILREIGLKVSCASCKSDLARLNSMNQVDILVQIEEIADRVMAIIRVPVEKSRVKSWICEAAEGA